MTEEELASNTKAWWTLNKPRIVLAIFGYDQHEVGAMAVGRNLRDAGAEVIYMGRFATPASIVATAFQEDADLIGVSCHSWEYSSYTPELLAELRARQLALPVVLGGSVITDADRERLIAGGVAAVFGPKDKRDDMLARLRVIIERSWSAGDSQSRPGRPSEGARDDS